MPISVYKLWRRGKDSNPRMVAHRSRYSGRCLTNDDLSVKHCVFILRKQTTGRIAAFLWLLAHVLLAYRVDTHQYEQFPQVIARLDK